MASTRTPSASTVPAPRDIAPGTPRWAVVCAHAVIWCVLPSVVWRTAIGFGADLGMTEAWRDFQRVPGPGTLYLASLSLATLGAACLTLGLVQNWGELVPRWVPVVGGRRLGAWPVTLVAGVGAVVVTGICVMSALNWERIMGFQGMPDPGWYAVATLAYVPALLWGPLLLAVTWAYLRRRRARSTTH